MCCKCVSSNSNRSNITKNLYVSVGAVTFHPYLQRTKEQASANGAGHDLALPEHLDVTGPVLVWALSAWMFVWVVLGDGHQTAHQICKA